MRHQGPAHKGDVGGAVQGKEVADGVDDHHRRRAGRPAGLERGPQLAGKAAPGQEAGQVGGALGMPGGQNEPQSRVGGQKFLKGVRHQFLFAGMGGGRQPYRPAGLPRFSFSSLQETAKFLEARFVPALEQTVVFQVAGEMESGGRNPQALKPLKIRERPRGDDIIKIKYTG